MYLQCTTTHFVQSGGFLKGSGEKKKKEAAANER